MIRAGIIHTQLAGLLAGLRHTEQFVICDSGLPLGDLPCVDLGYRYGAASFADVARTVIPALVIEGSWISAPMVDVNPVNLAVLRELGLAPQPTDHEAFKQRVLSCKFAIRTGENTFYANVICQAGVAFSK